MTNVKCPLGPLSLFSPQVAWIWALFFCYMAPEAQSFLRSLRFVLFKTWGRPRALDFLFVATMECLSAVGEWVENVRGEPWPQDLRVTSIIQK